MNRMIACTIAGTLLFASSSAIGQIVNSRTQGPARCEPIGKQVCAVNPKTDKYQTYDTECFAKAAGAKDIVDGACVLGCPTNYAPVCGGNGRSYDNACKAAQAHALVVHQGLCTP
jgi:Kazal-type serine protease inhibitor-like protein